MSRRIAVPLLILSLLAGCSSAPWPKAAIQEQPEQEPITIITNQAEQAQETPVLMPAPEQEVKPVPAAVETEKPVAEVTPTQITKQPQQAKPAAETPAKPAKEQQIIINDEGRLAHPWFYAKQVKDDKVAKPKWFGEELKFKIGWSFITAGESTLITSKLVEADGQYAYMIEAYAQSYSVIDKLFKVRDINASWISIDGKRSLGYWQSVREGRYARDEWLSFDYDNAAYTVNKQDRHGKISHEPQKFKGNNVFDMLSALYYVRMQPLPLKGELFFDIVNRNAQYPLKVVVHGRETVKVKAGKFDCIVVEPMISGEGIFVSKGKSLKVWLTDDEYKMPVKMSVEVFIGSVKAELVSYSRQEI